MSVLSTPLNGRGKWVTIAVILAAVTIGAWQTRSRSGKRESQSPSQGILASSGNASQANATEPVSTLFLQAGELARIIAAYQALPSALDRSRRDVAARAALLGSDPEAALAFVRDQLVDEVYPGVLRGGSGTLQAGAGNDLDKSVLLAALLTERGHRVRYARCTLSADLAASRIAALFERQGPRRLETDVEPQLLAALMRSGFSEARSAEFVASRRAARVWIDDVIIRTARSDLDVLRGVLSHARLTPIQFAPDPRIIDDARDHFWVQLSQAEGWRDLDPAVPESRRGSALCSAEATFDHLPPEVFQTIRLSIRNEYVNGEKLETQTVLDHRFPASDLYGGVIHVVNVGVPSSGGLLTSAAMERFLPLVRMPDEVVVGSEFDASPASGPAAGAIVDAFGGGGEPPAFAAQWIDFVLEAPGRRAIISRALIDLVDPKERARGTVATRPDVGAVALSLTQTWAIAISAGPVDPGAAIETAFRDFDATRTGRAFDSPEGRDDTDEALGSDRAQSEDALLAAYALSYSTIAERALDRFGASFAGRLRLTRDQPMVTIANLGFRQVSNRQDFVGELNVDVRHDQIRVVTKSPAHAEEGFWANVLRGLIDGALEHHLPALGLRAAHVTSSQPRQFDTTLAFRLAREQGIEIGAATGPEASDSLRESMADFGGLRLVTDVTDTTAIVRPLRPVLVGEERRFALWAIDRRTGNLLSILDTGLRGQQTERSQLERLINFLQTQIRRCVQNRRNMAVCRQMFQMWADAANRLRHIRRLPGRINVNNGHFTGFTF